MIRRLCRSKLSTGAKQASSFMHGLTLTRMFAVSAPQQDDLRQKIAKNVSLILDRTPNLRPKELLLEQTLVLYSKLLKKGEENTEAELHSIIEVFELDTASKFTKNIKEDLINTFLIQLALNKPSNKVSQLFNYHLQLDKPLAKKKALLDAILSSSQNIEDLDLTEENILRVIDYALETEKNTGLISSFVSRSAVHLNTKSSKSLRKLRYLLDYKLLSKCWDRDLGVTLFLNRAISYKLFMFLCYREFDSIQGFFEYLTNEKKLNFEQVSELITANNLDFLQTNRSAWSEGKKAAHASESLSPEDASKEFELKRDLYQLKQIVETRRKHGLELADITTQVRMMFINGEVKRVKWTVLHLLDFIETVSTLQIAEAEVYWEENRNLVQTHLQKAKSDFSLMLECNARFFSSKYLVEHFFYLYIPVLRQFLKEQFAPQHMDDTKSAIWERSLPELSAIIDSVAELRTLSNADSENSLYSVFVRSTSVAVSDCLADPFLHPEFDKDYDEFLMFQSAEEEKDQADDKKINKSQSQASKHKKEESRAFRSAEKRFEHIKPTDLNLAREKWLQLEPLVRVNVDYVKSWSPKTTELFFGLLTRMYVANMGTEKFIIGGQRALEALLETLPAERYGTTLRLLADMNFVTRDLLALIQEKILLKGTSLFKTLKASLKPSDFFKFVLDIAYFSALNKNYNQQAWNAITDCLDVPFIEQHLQALDNQDLALLGQVILLTRMEAPYVKTSKFDHLMDYFVGINQTEFNLFKPSDFSSTILSLLKKYYYDYLKPNGLAELFKVHLLQNKHAIICLDDSHFVSSSTIIKGRVELAIRLLKHLHFEAHIVSKKDYGFEEKRSARLNYLKKTLIGVEINEKRKTDVESTLFYE